MNYLKSKSSTLVMGILNITPDSFSDGGVYFHNIDKAVSRAVQIIDEGADYIDIGGESTRPGAAAISIEEEIKRVLPVLTAIRKKLKNIPISIDTYKSEVAKEALKNGANLINSLGGFTFDPDLAGVAARAKVPMIIYHIKGIPHTMQRGDIHYEDIIKEIKKFFSDQIKFGIQHGMTHNQFILDPGIGFGKTVEQNIEIIKRLSEFNNFSLPLAVGISRKSHLGKILAASLNLKKIPAEDERLEAALAETAVAVLNGASYIRTHDVSATKKFLSVLDMVK